MYLNYSYCVIKNYNIYLFVKNIFLKNITFTTIDDEVPELLQVYEIVLYEVKLLSNNSYYENFTTHNAASINKNDNKRNISILKNDQPHGVLQVSKVFNKRFSKINAFV